MNADLITETFLERLRNTTAVSHKNLEELPVSRSIMNPAVSNTEYILYLRLMHDIVKDTEHNIFPLLENIISDIHRRKKAQLIESDLAYLGHPKTGYATPLTGNSQVNDSAFALGIMYVVEGSSLGGRIILKNISAALGHDEMAGGRYFGGYGTKTGSSWRTFIEMMISFETVNQCEGKIIAGADFAFNAIAAHFKNATK